MPYDQRFIEGRDRDKPDPSLLFAKLKSHLQPFGDFIGRQLRRRRPDCLYHPHICSLCVGVFQGRGSSQSESVTVFYASGDRLPASCLVTSCGVIRLGLVCCSVFTRFVLSRTSEPIFDLINVG